MPTCVPLGGSFSALFVAQAARSQTADDESHTDDERNHRCNDASHDDSNSGVTHVS